MSENHQKFCDVYNTETTVKLTNNKSEKLSHVSFNVSGECGCDLGNVEIDLVLVK
jgi:hypothetical protein